MQKKSSVWIGTAAAAMLAFSGIFVGLAQEGPKVAPFPTQNVKNVGGDVTITQNVKPDSEKEKPSEPAAEPTTIISLKVPLTTEEAKDWEYNALQSENLEYKVRDLQKKIMEARVSLSKEQAALKEKFAKAHGVDPAKYEIDKEGKALVPAPPPAEKKPADKK